MQPPTERDPGQERPVQPPTPSAAPAIRASDREREAAVQRLQGAFAEGRIDDQEFDERMQAALTARTRAELDKVRVQVRGYSYGGHWADEVPDHDLPADAPIVQVRAVAYKGTVEARRTPTPGGQITRR